MEMTAELQRCRDEIAASGKDWNGPAYLPALGWIDWHLEMDRILLTERPDSAHTEQDGAV